MSDLPYFTRRTRPAPPEDQLEVNNNFWIAWRHLIREFGGRNYLCEHMADECVDGHPYGYTDVAIQRKLYREMGEVDWPKDDFEMPSDQGLIFDFIEFFSRFVSKPKDSWFHSFCGNSHPTEYDSETGRAEYAAEVNRLFKNFRHPYRLSDGQVWRENSAFLDTPLLNIELQTDDGHLRQLIEGAIRDFQDRSGGRKGHALRQIVDALERLKTICDPDKKRSVTKVIAQLSPEEAVRAAFDEDMRTLTDIGNRFCIRHHERGQKPITDEVMVEFLFYLYFNYVRLILKKHHMLKVASPPKGPAVSTDDDIPF